MQYSYINSTGNGASVAFQIPFPFIDATHVFTTTAESFSVVDQTLIFDEAPTGSFRIYRKTPPILKTATASMFRNEEFEDVRNLMLANVTQGDVDAAVEGLRAELLPEIALAQTKNFSIAGPELDPDEFPDPAPTWVVQPSLLSDQQVNTYRRTVQFRWTVPDPSYSFCRVTSPTDSIDRVVYGNEITLVDLSWTTPYTFTFQGYNNRGQATENTMGYAIAGFAVVAGPPLGIISVDTIEEDTPDNGVEIDGLLIKDGGLDNLKVGDANAHQLDNIWRGSVTINTTISADSTYTTPAVTIAGARVGDIVLCEQPLDASVVVTGRVTADDTVLIRLRNTNPSLGLGLSSVVIYFLVINHF